MSCLIALFVWPFKLMFLMTVWCAKLMFWTVVWPLKLLFGAVKWLFFGALVAFVVSLLDGRPHGRTCG